MSIFWQKTAVMSMPYSDFFSTFYVHYGLLAIFAFSVPFLITVLNINKKWRLLFPPIKKNASWEGAISQFRQEVVPQLTRGGIECPYEYILQVYGRCHFKKLVNILDPTLEARDPGLFRFILELLDSVHFGAILVDDVADNSVLRKGKPAAHHVYGTSETINRAYLRLLEVIDICTKQRPSMIPYILDNLTQIHKGQDISLVWRRDGFPDFPDREQALAAYRQSAYLKTGALFRLCGQLVFGSREKDELMSQVGWFCHLQNDCKNIYSTDVTAAKGVLAEDLKNGEYSFPIVLAIYASPTANTIIKEVFRGRRESGATRNKQITDALTILYNNEVKSACMAELELLKDKVSPFVTVWGRQENMNLGPGL
ncbi:Isoprenoid synthase domain containing protein [Elaphomyces granulatus]